MFLFLFFLFQHFLASSVGIIVIFLFVPVAASVEELGVALVVLLFDMMIGVGI